MAAVRLCAIPSCGKKHYCKGYCEPHYQRLRKHGDPLGGKYYADNAGACSVEGCDLKASARGYCKKHYRRWERSGSPHGTNSYDGEQEQWLRNRTGHPDNDCLIWPYFINPNGYGVARKGGKNVGAHRLMCEYAHGAAPSAEHEAAHSCNVRSCVNPNHIRWATKSENMMDKTEHGTQLLGEKNHQNKLTSEQVIAIRKLEGVCTLSEAAEQFGVHLGTIHRIWKREAWAWL